MLMEVGGVMIIYSLKFDLVDKLELKKCKIFSPILLQSKTI